MDPAFAVDPGHQRRARARARRAPPRATRGAGSPASGCRAAPRSAASRTSSTTIASAWRRASRASSRSRSTSASASSRSRRSSGSTAARSAPPPIATASRSAADSSSPPLASASASARSSDAGRVTEPEPLGLELGVLAGPDPDGCRGPRRDRAPAAARRPRCSPRDARQRPPRMLHARPGPLRSRRSRCRALRAAERIEHVALPAPAQHPMAGPLRGDVDAEVADLAQHGLRHERAVDPAGCPPGGGDLARERDQVVVGNPELGAAGSQARARIVEDSGHARARTCPVRTVSGSSRPPSAARSALTHMDFPEPVSPVRTVKPVIEREPSLLDDREVADAQLTKRHWPLHGRLACHRPPARATSPCGVCRSGTSAGGGS